MTGTWYATGRLQPLWTRYAQPPYQREKLATAVGTSPSVLSQINSGKRRLGMDLGPRLAQELGVTLLDLGKPADEGILEDMLVLDRLAQLEGDLAEAVQGQAKVVRQVATLQARVRKLEARREPGRGAAGGRP